MKTPNKYKLTIRRAKNPDTGRLVWEWFYEDANGFLAGGYCATKADAESDARNHSFATYENQR